MLDAKLSAVKRRIVDCRAKVSWKLKDYSGVVVASGTGTNFSISLTNTVYVPGGARTSVVADVTASIAATPIFSGQPFDVTCTMSGTAQGSAPVIVSLWISTDNRKMRYTSQTA